MAHRRAGLEALAGEAQIMGWAVILLPDERGDAAARRVWRAVHDAGFGSMLFEGDNRPHLSLTVLEAQDGSLESAVESFAAGAGHVSACFASIGSFGEDVIYISPEPSAALHEMNRRLTSTLGKLAALADPRYLPGEWRPHMTVAFNIPEGDFNRAMRVVKNSFVPFPAVFESVAMVKFNPVKIVSVYRLGANENPEFGGAPLHKHEFS
jgi:2'-5' RNA ligase